MKRIALLINPIAGMGGRVGLKGTDGLAAKAREAGARPVAAPRALMFLRLFRERQLQDPSLSLRWLTCSGTMGQETLEQAGVPPEEFEVVHSASEETTAEDTKAAAEKALAAHAELLLFVGGDGTARDIVASVGDVVPILGIPAGVKMHSGLFSVSPVAAVDILSSYLRGELRVGDAEILDLDEEAYRRGDWRIRFFGTAKTLVEPNLIQTGKMMVAEISEETVLEELAEHFTELFDQEPDTLFLLGPGSTVHSLATRLGIEKTLLGVDAALGRKTIGRDANEVTILHLLKDHPAAKLVVSPIGAQGFILGRGNLQLSPEVVRRIGMRNVLVVATPGKLLSTPVLRVDTGDPGLDAEFHKREYLFVLIGYRTTKLHPIHA